MSLSQQLAACTQPRSQGSGEKRVLGVHRVFFSRMDAAYAHGTENSCSFRREP